MAYGLFMIDVLVAGAGPAGSIAALVLARAGARVLIVDRETFPRDKLCGDTLNPGALALLDALELRGGPLEHATLLRGMRVTGGRSGVTTLYKDGKTARALSRRALDTWLLEEAVRAGARFEGGWIVRDAIVDPRPGRPVIRGLVIASRSAPDKRTRIPAVMTIGADGRRSAVARAAKLSRPSPPPRRWAFGAYMTGIDALGDVGEMHVHPGRYVGIAPMAGAVANVCVVTGPRPEGRTPAEIMRQAIAANRRIAPRFVRAEFVTEVRVLGPLGVAAAAPGIDGLLLAGDAAGFVDPITGDGVSLAIRGATLAASEVLRTLENGDFAGAAGRLAAARHRCLGSKTRFNRAVRSVVESRTAIELMSCAAAVAPAMFRPLVRYAGE